MTHMPDALAFDIARKLPRYELMLRLEVFRNGEWKAVMVLHGSLVKRKALRAELERQRYGWEHAGHFGEAPLRIQEFQGSFARS